MQGEQLTCLHFLSGRVKLIVTSERLNIYKNMLPPVESQVIFLSKETPIVSVDLRTVELHESKQNGVKIEVEQMMG
jgi:ABC-type amino acid transport system permease subunit